MPFTLSKSVNSPSCLLIIILEIYKPRPVPLSGPFVVIKGSKRFSFTLSGIPGPSSLIVKLIKLFFGEFHFSSLVVKLFVSGLGEV